MSERLNPLTLPLMGSQLIEASAGTGKTWTIAALVVRLVLGHGTAGQGLGRPLLPGEILVMTFTKAATRELSDRIRARLVEAAACFRGQPDAKPDAFLTALLAAYPVGPARQQAAWRLAMAAEAMDDAAVHTIDAWCQRMLREHAFDSGSLFDEELQASEAALLAQAARDYWRQQVYPLDGAALDLVLSQWKDPAALQKDLRDLLSKPLPPGAGQGGLAAWLGERQTRLNALKSGWPARADAMLAWSQAMWADKKHPASKAAPGKRWAADWLATLKQWAESNTLQALSLSDPALVQLSGQAMRAKLGGAPDTEPPAEFDDFDRLLMALDALPQPGPALRLHAAAHVTARMHQAKQQAGTFGFSDLLARLDAALDEEAQGAKAQRLRQRILDQYPVALIDEFQDTSPVQLRIFDRLYRIADNEPTRALLLIGDPKQAIYRFRGADINSYLQARRATQGRHHVLDTNFRSTKALVDAVNHVFQQAEGRPGEGAFLYRDAAAGGTSELPFVEVQAQGRAEHFATAQGPAAALTLVTDADLRNAVKSHAVYAALCAERIVAWLNDPQAGFSEDTKPWRRVRPADVAVLVRTGKEADAVRRALRQRGLASVYLSDKDTVFSTPEAADLLRLLRAVAAPRDVRLARAALATALLGLPLEELLQLAQDDERFDRQCETLQQLNTTWKAQGVLAMLRRALHVFGVPAQLLAQPGGTGERSLTNVLHLAELLQAASVQMEGEQALIRWLGEQIADGEAGLVGSGTGGGTGGDEPVLRLESDADLVQIVTIHKSKGLEYPLVLLPFASLVRGNRNSDQDVLMLPGAGGASELVLSPSDAQREVAAREDLREQLRLLYVALTRARHALWVGLPGQQTGKQKDCLWHRSAVGYLLSGPDKQPPEQRLLDVQALAQACSHVCVEQPELANDHVPLTPVRLHQTLPPLTPAPAYSAAFDRQWTISSYSALVRDAAWGPGGADPMPARVLREDEPEDSSAVEGPVRHAADLPWHRFPRGAFAGNFLHDQLEWLAGEGFALDTSTPLQDALQRRCERQGWGHRADEVLAWLRRVCSTPLPAVGVALAGLAASTPEMEFWFPSDGLQAGRIDALCRQHLLHGQARPVLPERTLKGLLMGFADLVFEHEGRYWVLDYKSNALGLRDADYTQAAMQAAMLEHRYDVQAALYLLALHRLLKARLGAAYRPAQQLGGAVYFFLRGVRSASAGCCTVPAPLALLDALDGLLPPSRMGAAE